MARQVKDVMKRRHFACTCGEKVSLIRWGKDDPLTCPVCQQDMVEVAQAGNASAYVIGDEIPGGLDVKHGICNADGTPRKFYSKTEIKKAAFEAGWTILGDTPKPNQRIAEERHREAEKKGRSWH